MKKLTFAAIALSLVGCASPYKRLGTFGAADGGYSDTLYSPDVAKIRFHGNRVTSDERAQDFALLRAAELCLQSGYRYFYVAEDKVDAISRTVTTPERSYTTANAVPVGNMVSYYQTTSYTPSQTVTISRPEASVLVKFLHSKPKNVGVFDAQFIQSSLKAKYKLT